MNQAELIEITKTAIQGSEAEVARRVEVTPQSLSDFKKGKRAMPDRIAVRLARLAGLDPASTLTEIEAEKADDETREVWKEIARRTSAAALMVALIGSALPIQGLDKMYIMLSQRLSGMAHRLPLQILPRCHRLLHH